MKEKEKEQKVGKKIKKGNQNESFLFFFSVLAKRQWRNHQESLEEAKPAEMGVFEGSFAQKNKSQKNESLKQKKKEQKKQRPEWVDQKINARLVRKKKIQAPSMSKKKINKNKIFKQTFSFFRKKIDREIRF